MNLFINMSEAKFDFVTSCNRAIVINYANIISCITYLVLRFKLVNFILRKIEYLLFIFRVAVGVKFIFVHAEKRIKYDINSVIF